MASTCLADHLPRTTITQVRYCAGIDDIDIGDLAEVALRKASLAHLLADGFTIGLVDLAPQRGYCKGCFC